MFDQSALSNSGLSDDVDHPSVAGSSVVDGVREGVEFGLSPHEHQLGATGGTDGAGGVLAALVADERRPDRLGLALDHERLQGSHLELGRNEVEHGRARHHLADGRLLHQPGSEVDRVSHHRERAPARRAEIAHVDRAAVQPDAQRETDVDRHQLAGGTDCGVLVLAGRSRCAGGEDDLAAAGVDVARQPEHAVARCGLLGGARERLESFVDGVGALGRQERVDPTEEDEADRDGPMLCHDAGGGLLDQPTGHVCVDGAVGRQAARQGARRWARCQHASDVGRLSEVGGVEQFGGGMAQQDLAALGRALAVDRRRHAGADHEQLLMSGVDEVEVEGAAVNSL